MDRREFLYKSALLSSSALLPTRGSVQANSPEAPIQHLIPLTSHDSILIKASFVEPLHSPSLKIGSKEFNGHQRDTIGRFWSFHATDLESNTQYELSLRTSGGGPLAESWPLRTAPALDSQPERLRVLVYTCAGGPDDALWLNGEWRFLPVATRQRLLHRALDFDPDLAIAVGDQTYWDQTISPRKRGGDHAANRERVYGKYGKFDREKPVFGSTNELTLTRCLDEQIASLYGTAFRSVPTILTQDDHDYFENDEGTDEFVTFPPRNFSARLGRAQQGLYFPEFLPEPNRPTHLAVSSRFPGPRQISLRKIPSAGSPPALWMKERLGMCCTYRHCRWDGRPANGVSGIRMSFSRMAASGSGIRSRTGNRDGSTNTNASCPPSPARRPGCRLWFRATCTRLRPDKSSNQAI